MAFSGMINLKSGQLTLGGQFEAYKRGQLERNIQNNPQTLIYIYSSDSVTFKSSASSGMSNNSLNG